MGGFAAFIVLIALLMALPILLAWNLGVVGISHALGGHIHTISFWVALGASLAIGVLARLIRPDGAHLEIKR